MNSSQPAVQRSPQLPREEYIEQAHLYKLLRERTGEQVPIQELLEQIHLELLATTKLPMAIDYLLCEVKHSGLMAPAMSRMSHYFSAFQTYLIQQSEEETGRFLTATAFEVLEADAKYRLEGASASGMFFFQFEVLCRNRLNYDKGLWAMSNDPLYDEPMSKWVLYLRHRWGWSSWRTCCFWRASITAVDSLLQENRRLAKVRSCLAKKKAGSPSPIVAKIRCICFRQCSGTWATLPCRDPNRPIATRT